MCLAPYHLCNEVCIRQFSCNVIALRHGVFKPMCGSNNGVVWIEQGKAQTYKTEDSYADKLASSDASGGRGGGGIGSHGGGLLIRSTSLSLEYLDDDVSYHLQLTYHCPCSEFRIAHCLLHCKLQRVFRAKRYVCAPLGIGCIRLDRRIQSRTSRAFLLLPEARVRRTPAS